MSWKIVRAGAGASGPQVATVAAQAPFRLAGIDYPADWLARGGTLPGHEAHRVDPPPPPPPPARWRTPYVAVLERLPEAAADPFAGHVEALPARRRERIRRDGIWSDDAEARARIAELGADPDAVLAP